MASKMTANVKLQDGSTFYGVTRFDVPKGARFVVELQDAPGPMHWFADQDQVLEYQEAKDLMSAAFEATGDGVSLVQLRGPADDKILELTIKVFDGEVKVLRVDSVTIEPVSP